MEENHIAKFDKDELVYLTSDSSNILKGIYGLFVIDILFILFRIE